MLTQSQVSDLFERFAKQNPHPKTELQYANPFTLLVAVVLSAQATDKGVNKATKSLFQTVDTPQKMLDLGEDQLRESIKSIGLFKTKARNIIGLSKLLLTQHNGHVPNDRVSLEALPGVGRKTANVVLNVAFGQPTMGVDTHIFRVSNRVGLSPGKTPRDVEEGLLKVIPEHWKHHAHHWLILHGRYICKAQKPLCPECPVNDLCEYPDKTT
ncbi:MAG: endonuclease III [Pseudomonadota bacterium]